MNLSWNGLVIIYLITALPFIFLIATTIFIIKDLFAKKFNKTTKILLAITVLFFALTQLFSGAI